MQAWARVHQAWAWVHACAREDVLHVGSRGLAAADLCHVDAEMDGQLQVVASPEGTHIETLTALVVLVVETL